jgi:sulfite exporter TauE/SafE
MASARREGAGESSRRVVAWGHAQVPPQHDVIGPGDLEDDSSYGRLLLRSLMRAQLGLSLLCLALALTVTASYPIIVALVPAAGRVRILGLPLALIVLGVGIYPVLLVIGWFYNRQASQLEARFIDLVEPVERGRT